MIVPIVKSPEPSTLVAPAIEPALVTPPLELLRLVNVVAPKELAPVEVIAPQPTVPIVAMFLLPSRTRALEAVAVPAVTST